MCKNCDEGEFSLCKVGLYSGTTGLSHAQVLLFFFFFSLSLSLIYLYICVL